MTDETKHDTGEALAPGLAAARAAAWEEHEQRCADNEPYTGGVTVEAPPSASKACVARTPGPAHRDRRDAVEGLRKPPPARPDGPGSVNRMQSPKYLQ